MMVAITIEVERSEAWVSPRTGGIEILLSDPATIVRMARADKDLILFKGLGPKPSSVVQLQTEYVKDLPASKIVVSDEYPDMIKLQDVFHCVVKPAAVQSATVGMLFWESVASMTRENAFVLILRTSKAPFNDANIHHIADKEPAGPFLYLKPVKTADGLAIKRRISKLLRIKGYSRLRSNGMQFFAKWQNPEPDVIALVKAGPVRVSL